MRGDKLVIHEGHVRAARQILELLLPKIMEIENEFIITIGGESGSGKSEIAESLSKLLSEKNIKSIIFQQDDYFVYPPKTNAQMRRKNINWVGPSEVKLALLDKNLKSIMEGKSEVEKPLVIFDEDRISKEIVKVEGIKVVIVDGTHTTILKNAHQHIFIDRIHLDTQELRRQRAREEQDEFLEKILKIEHRIISSHKSNADIIVTKKYEVRKVRKGEQTKGPQNQ